MYKVHSSQVHPITMLLILSVPSNSAEENYYKHNTSNNVTQPSLIAGVRVDYLRSTHIHIINLLSYMV